jgi:hypothetical protein
MPAASRPLLGGLDNVFQYRLIDRVAAKKLGEPLPEAFDLCLDVAQMRPDLGATHHLQTEGEGDAGVARWVSPQQRVDGLREGAVDGSRQFALDRLVEPLRGLDGVEVFLDREIAHPSKERLDPPQRQRDHQDALSIRAPSPHVVLGDVVVAARRAHVASALRGGLI